jgi:DNA polymerase-3 subunit alpha
LSQIDLNYVVYHLHSDLSNGVTNVDSVTKFKEYIEKAKEFGMKAMAFSEHGSVFEWYHKKEAIEAAGMKYIQPIERQRQHILQSIYSHLLKQKKK